MNQSLINIYQIELRNKVIDYDIKGKEVRKIIITNNNYLDMFLDDWSVEDIEEILLPDISQALSDSNVEIQNGSETVSILIYQNKVDFYTFDDGFVYTMPTSDFKQIVEGWRDFLLTPPLNGPYIGN